MLAIQNHRTMACKSKTLCLAFSSYRCLDSLLRLFTFVGCKVCHRFFSCCLFFFCSVCLLFRQVRAEAKPENSLTTIRVKCEMLTSQVQQFTGLLFKYVQSMPSICMCLWLLLKAQRCEFCVQCIRHNALGPKLRHTWASKSKTNPPRLQKISENIKKYSAFIAKLILSHAQT